MDLNLNIRFGLCHEHCHKPHSRLVACFGEPESQEITPVAVEHNIAIGGAGVKLVLKPEKNGAVEPVDGSASVVFDDPTDFVATLDATDPSGLTFILTTTATAPTTTNGTASVDADTGPGVNTISFDFTLNAVLPQADTLVGEFTDL